MFLKLTVAFVMIKTNVCNIWTYNFIHFMVFITTKQTVHKNKKDNPAQHKGF